MKLKTIIRNIITPGIFVCVVLFIIGQNNAKKTKVVLKSNQEKTLAKLVDIEELLLKSKDPSDKEKVELNNTVSEISKYLEENPSDYRGYRNRSIAKAGLTNYEGAIKDINTALALDSLDVNLYNYRANFYKNLGNLDQAIDNYSIILKLDSTRLKTIYNRGTLHLKNKEYNLAINDFNEFINKVEKNDSDLGNAYNGLGMAYKNLRDHEAFLSAMTEAVKVEPKNENFIGHKAFAYLKLKQFNNAIEEYTNAINLNPSNPDYYKYRANAYKNSGKRNLEKIDLEKFRELKSQ